MSETVSPDRLREQVGTVCTRDVSVQVDHIRHISNPTDRLAMIEAVFQGMLDTEAAERQETFGGMRTGVPGREHWGTGRVSPWGRHSTGPLVGSSLGAPPARFERVGRPKLDYAAMHFIVAARENFEFLLELAKEALARQQSADTESPDNCDGQLCYYHGCQHLAGCVQRAISQENPNG